MASDERVLALTAFGLLVLLWLLVPSGLPRGVAFTADPDDGVPTIPKDQFLAATRDFLEWAWPKWLFLVLPVLAGLGAWKALGASAGFGLAGLGFEILGAVVLAEGLLDFKVIRWHGTWGWLGPRSRQASLSAREKTLRGLYLLAMGFLLQALATVLTAWP